MNEKGVTRKNSPPIKVYCLPTERQQLKENARSANLSVSSYLLTVGLAYRVTGVVDAEKVQEMARINGDLGRLGGLLKLWLTDDPRTQKFGESTIRALLAKIEATQSQLGDVMLKVVMPRKEL